MKVFRYIAVIAVMFASSLHVSAQEYIRYSDRIQKCLEEIKEANSQIRSISGEFEQRKKFVSGRKINSSGQMYVSFPDRLAMHYDEPAGDKFIINGQSMYQKRNRKENSYDLSRNQLMNNLSNTLLWSFSGNVEELIKAYAADVSISDEVPGMIRISISSKAKSSKGYSFIELLYDKKDLHLRMMATVESNGAETIYILKSPVFDCSIPDDRF